MSVAVSQKVDYHADSSKITLHKSARERHARPIFRTRVNMLKPKADQYCQFDPSEPARLIVVIDTEEEFDWSRPVARSNISVSAMRSILRIQDVFDEYGVTPVYVIDYPVVDQAIGFEPLLEIQGAGRCHIGAHLHPWVNPPHDEEVCARNSFPGSLPKDLEAAKLRILTDRITEVFGAPPTTYKAGRYGIGPNTAEILENLGYLVDVSVRARTDFSDIEGPDFTDYSAWPYWFGSQGQLLEIPVASGYSGLLRHWGPQLHRFSGRTPARAFRTRGIMKRSGLLKKLDLSPEGFSLDDLVKLVPILHAQGLRVFGLAFHSPSLEPGNTPYVRSQRELDSFIGRCRQFLDWFVNDFGGSPSDPLEIRSQLLNTRPESRQVA